MENVSEMIWEIVCAVVFAIGISFLFYMSTRGTKATDIVNQDIRNKMDIREDASGYTGLNIADRSDVIFDVIGIAKEIIDAGDDLYVIIIDGREVAQEDIIEAANGNVEKITSLVTSPKYQKKYRQEKDGKISAVEYVTYTGS